MAERVKSSARVGEAEAGLRDCKTKACLHVVLLTCRLLPCRAGKEKKKKHQMKPLNKLLLLVLVPGLPSFLNPIIIPLSPMGQVYFLQLKLVILGLIS